MGSAMSADRLVHASGRSQWHCWTLLIACVLVGAAGDQLGRWVEAEILKLAEVAVGAFYTGESPLNGNENSTVPGLLRVAYRESKAGEAPQMVDEQKSTSIIASASLDISAAGEVHWLSEQWDALMREFGF